MIALSVIAIAVAIRSGWPARHPSPKKLPGPRIPMTACFPCRERTVSLTFPRSTKKTTSARSPCEKIVWFFRQSLVVLPAPTVASNALGSSADFAFRFIVVLYLKSPSFRFGQRWLSPGWWLPAPRSRASGNARGRPHAFTEIQEDVSPHSSSLTLLMPSLPPFFAVTCGPLLRRRVTRRETGRSGSNTPCLQPLENGSV